MAAPKKIWRRSLSSEGSSGIWLCVDLAGRHVLVGECRDEQLEIGGTAEVVLH